MTPRQRYTLLAAALLVLAAALAGAGLWRVLSSRPPAAAVALRLPGNDAAPADRSGDGAAVDLAGTFRAGEGTPSALPGHWPRFRGADGDNIAKDAPPLADAWPAEGPKVLWRIPVGEGYAGAAVANGRVYLADYDEKTRADAVRCLSLDDGREIWRRSYRVTVKKNHGMSRTVPAITDKHLVSMGPRCHVVCLDPNTGDFCWGLDLQKDYGTKEPLWYTGQCPLVEGDRAILAPCGTEVLMMAVDCATGEVLWKAPNPDGVNMSHASVFPMTLAGRRMYVYAAVGGVAGVSAEPDTAGELLWRVPWKARVVAPSALAIGPDRVLCLAGYGEGGLILKIAAEGGAFTAAVESAYSPKDGIASEQHTPILHDGLLYTVQPKDAGGLRAQFACFRPDNTLVWSSGSGERFGLGPFLLADGKFFVMDDEGTLSLLRQSPERFELLARAKVLNGHESWGPMALAGDRLLVRDSMEMACVFVGKEGS